MVNLKNQSTSPQCVTSSNHSEVGEPPYRIGTFNVVICGEAGACKSSLVNLIAGMEIAVTSSSASGCTAGTNAYDISMIRDQTFKVKLVDTAGSSSLPLFIAITELDYRSGRGPWRHSPR